MISSIEFFVFKPSDKAMASWIRKFVEDKFILVREEFNLIFEFFTENKLLLKFQQNLKNLLYPILKLVIFSFSSKTSAKDSYLHQKCHLNTN